LFSVIASAALAVAQTATVADALSAATGRPTTNRSKPRSSGTWK